MPRILKTRRLKETKNKTRSSSKKGGARLVLDNKSIRKAVKDYLEGGSAKENVIDKYGIIEDWNTSKVTDMWALFKGMKKFNYNISKWNVSNVTDMSEMFYGAESFNQSLHSWKVRRVKNMRALFAEAINFNQPIEWWNVSNVENMDHMFYRAYKFNKFIGGWDVSNVTDMSYMFAGAYNFSQSIGDWDVSNVTDMSGMFASATNFNRPINKWDVSNVVNVRHMFSEIFDISFKRKLTSWGDKLPKNTDFSLIFGSYAAKNTLTKSERKFLDKIAPWFLYDYENSIAIKKFVKRAEEDRECSICMDSIDPKDKKNIMITPCNHAYHKDCLRRWMTNNRSCPDCRTKLPESK